MSIWRAHLPRVVDVFASSVAAEAAAAGVPDAFVHGHRAFLRYKLYRRLEAGAVDAPAARPVENAEIAKAAGGGCNHRRAWPQTRREQKTQDIAERWGACMPVVERVTVHPRIPKYNTGAEHVGFSRARRTWIAPSAKHRYVSGESHDGDELHITEAAFGISCGLYFRVSTTASD